MYELLTDPGNYPFAWLEQVISILLNPEVTPVLELSPEQLNAVEARLPEASAEIMLKLKAWMFLLLVPEQLRQIARNTEAAVADLLRRASANYSAYPPGTAIAGLGRQVIRRLEMLHRDLSERHAPYLPAAGTASPGPVAPPGRITCLLSVDQLGLILKAADDARLIRSPSLSLIFKTLVPYLSTERKEDLSWDSMRSSTYHPEHSDQEAAIAALDKLIQKIREYR
ncbi:hypothetical protein [Mucilaginibacter ginsenosidivorans]|uniref:Uncharacterized protein n=1 Tax=Mucilaginibacter ginsenosidivorans TaxID=398053 RepID=A0A5B8UTP1_9SPHI|nr:hypothetical protein [Mucilaginibacter ginsenosidivorans]QEC62480.1 hypothetical protein FRZ54_07730 [Mucilaginibacter ginsenosidivorans]